MKKLLISLGVIGTATIAAGTVALVLTQTRNNNNLINKVLTKEEVELKIQEIEKKYQSGSIEQQKDKTHNKQYLDELLELATQVQAKPLNEKKDTPEGGESDYYDKGHTKFAKAIDDAKQVNSDDYKIYQQAIMQLKKAMFDFLRENATDYKQLNKLIMDVLDVDLTKPNKQGKDALRTAVIAAMTFSNDARKTQIEEEKIRDELEAARTKFEQDNKTSLESIKKNVQEKQPDYEINKPKREENTLLVDFLKAYEVAEKTSELTGVLTITQTEVDIEDLELEKTHFLWKNQLDLDLDELIKTIGEAYHLYNLAQNPDQGDVFMKAIEQAEAIAFNKENAPSQKDINEANKTLKQAMDEFTKANKTNKEVLEKAIVEAEKAKFNDKELTDKLNAQIVESKKLLLEEQLVSQLRIDFEVTQLNNLVRNLQAVDKEQSINTDKDAYEGKVKGLIEVIITNNDKLLGKEYEYDHDGLDIFYASDDLDKLVFLGKKAGTYKVTISAKNAVETKEITITVTEND